MYLYDQDIIKLVFTASSKAFFQKRFIFIFGCTGSSFLSMGFLQLQGVRATLQLCYVGFSVLWITGSRVRGLQQLLLMSTIIAACGLLSTGSGVVGPGLSLPTAHGIFQDQGSKAGVPLHCKQILNHWTTGKASRRTFLSETAFLYFFLLQISASVESK